TDRFSFYGYPVELTPNLHKLTQTGAVFRRAYCYGGNTTASMGAIFTSRFPYWPLEVPGGGGRWDVKHHFGFSRFQSADDLKPGIPDSLPTLPLILKEHGYTTVGLSTNPYLTRDFNFNRGFDFFEEFSSHWRQPYPGVELVIKKLDAYLSQLKDQAFFAWIHLMDMHHPLREFEPYLEEARSRGDRTGPPAPPVSEWTQEAVHILTDFGSRHVPDWEEGGKGLKKARDMYILAYEAELFRIDRQIGVLMDKLRQYGLEQDTLLMVVTDHGEEFAEHTYWDHRGQLYEPIVRGVWMMHNPLLFPSPVKVEERVSLVDLMPTLVDLLGLKHRGTPFDGESRISLLKKAPQGEDGLVFGVLDRRAYVIEGDHKLMLNGDYGKKSRGAHPDPPPAPVELYNLKEDPHELHNLAEKSPEIADRLLVKLKKAFLNRGIRFWEEGSSKELSKKTLERLKSLGYIK
ncbi:MAG: sulfatase, partial [Candidatus Aminicenantes bacterium]